jgi:hypothetical protein
MLPTAAMAQEALASTGHTIVLRPDTKMPDKHVQVHLLTRLSSEEQAKYDLAFAEDQQVDWVKPQYVPWTEDREGDMQDVWHL